jgi:hypothetical protein
MLDKLKEELKEDKQKQLNETQENNDKKLKKSEKQLSTEDFNKLQNESMEIMSERERKREK